VQTELSGNVAVGRATFEEPTGVVAVFEKVIYPLVLTLYVLTAPPLKLKAKGMVWAGEYCNA
jgi:hypothetical protein